MFNDRDLNYYWQEYAGQLPKEQDALAKRMQMLRPALLNNSTTFVVVVSCATCIKVSSTSKRLFLLMR